LPFAATRIIDNAAWVARFPQVLPKIGLLLETAPKCSDGCGIAGLCCPCQLFYEPTTFWFRADVHGGWTASPARSPVAPVMQVKALGEQCCSDQRPRRLESGS
jgi:hypothetical protein